MTAKSNAEYCFNWLDTQLPSPAVKRFYAQDIAMLAATEALLGVMEQRGVSRSELAERIGKSKGFVSQVLSGSRNMTLRTLADLFWALGLEVRDIAVRPLGESRVKPQKVDEWLDTDCEVIRVEASSDREFAVHGSIDPVAA